MDAGPEFRKTWHGAEGRGLHDEHDIARLMRWDAGGRLADESYARLKADPRLPQVVRTLASNMIDAAANDKALDGIFKDAGRYVAAMFAVHLHVSGGLTLPRLKELCASSGILSPGRARALLLYLRYLGYVKPLSPALRGEPTRYVPTDAFTGTWRNHMRAALGSVRAIEPGVDAVLDRLGDEAVLGLFCRLHSENLFAAAQGNGMESAFSRVFLQRHAGTQIIWTILLASEENGFPPHARVPFSISGVARKFNVSRVHIKRLMAQAEREKLLRMDGEGGVALSEDGRAAIAFTYSTQLICLLDAAARTLRARVELATSGLPPRMRTPIDTSGPASPDIISGSIPV